MTLPFSRLRLLLLALLTFTAPAWSRQLVWDSLLGATGEGTSEVVAIRAPTDSGTSAPAFVALNFSGPLALPGLSVLDPLAVPSAVVLRYSDDDNGHCTRLDWSARIRSAGGVTITGLATSNGSGEVFVCGISEGAPVFSESLLPIGTKNARGFVARLDPAAGIWLGHFIIDSILPTGIAICGDDVFVTGTGCLAAAYSPGGAVRWRAAAAEGSESRTHIDARPDGIHVLSKQSAADDAIVLNRLSPLTGAVLGTFATGERGNDEPAGLRVGRDGTAWIGFNSKPDAGPSRGYVARVRADGTFEGKVGLGTPDAAAEMMIGALDLDAEGNAWIGARLNGSWAFPDLDPQSFDNDVALLAVDRTGLVFELLRGAGDGTESATAVCASLPGMAMLGGTRAGGSGLSLGSLPLLASTADLSMFLSTARQATGLRHWIFRNDPASGQPLDLPALRHHLRGLGISLYLDVDNGPLGSAVTGYATPPQLDLLRAIGGVVAEPEIELAPNSADRGWALARLADAANTARPQDSVAFEPIQTTGGVRLYLIDTAVKHVANWFAGNDKLVHDGTVLVRGSGDPVTSSKFEHGTRMWSMIAGPETGAAARTPIRMLNFDIYPDDNSTSGLIANAILEAVDHHAEEGSSQPAVICLASGSNAPADSTVVRMALETAVEAGITVVIAAGNSGELASSYVPSRYGTMNGVVCVGASGFSNERSALSNHGSAVDLFAPGDTVRTLRYVDPRAGSFDVMNGTSASAAYASAAAILELSLDPALTPDAVEAALESSAYPGPLPIIQLAHPIATSIVERSSTGTDDDDHDGVADLIERFHGSSPEDPASRPSAITLQPAGGSVTAKFRISEVLFDPAHPYLLSDGSHWQVLVSEDLIHWLPAQGNLVTGSSGDGTLEARFTFASQATRGFVKLEVTPGS